jgi:hypothetical protein
LAVAVQAPPLVALLGLLGMHQVLLVQLHLPQQVGVAAVHKAMEQMEGLAAAHPSHLLIRGLELLNKVKMVEERFREMDMAAAEEAAQTPLGRRL